MSADNGYVIRKTVEKKFALQEYSASADNYPPVTEAMMVFDTLEAACLAYAEIENQPNSIIEYGLSIRVNYPFPESELELVTDGVTCQGCGTVRDSSWLGKAHACWKNDDGTYEEGGTFQ